MGTLIGHVAPGIGFLIIGLWHLFNTIRNYAQQGPWAFETRPWFPAAPPGSRRRRLELYAIIGGAALSIAAELFIGPRRHQPFGPNLSIPPEHLNNFEHATISLFLLLYAAIAAAEDASKLRLPDGTLHFLAAIAFSVELLIFHLHSSDHMGLEGHYHWLLQLVVGATLVATLAEMAAAQRSFWLAMARAASLALQGVWFVQMGLVLWVPKFTPSGCSLKEEGYHRVVRCVDEESEHRAKALATLQFAWYVAVEAAVVVTALGAALRSGSGVAPRFEPIPCHHLSDDDARSPKAASGGEKMGKLLQLSTSSASSMDGGAAHSMEEGLSMIEFGR